MTIDPDREEDMLTSTHDIHLADAVLDGDPLGDAPAGYQPLVDLVRKAQHTAPHQDVPADAAVIAAISAAVREGAAAAPERGARRSRPATRAAIVLAAAIVFGGAGAAAAATNHLPAAVQSFVSGTANHVGIDVPSPDDDDATTPPADAGHAPSDSGSDADTTTAPPTSQPEASVGAGGDDQRPDCAGNPASDQPDCAVGQPDQTSPSTSDDTPGGPPSTKHANNGNPDPGVPPTTAHVDHGGGVSSDHSRDPHQTSSS